MARFRRVDELVEIWIDRNDDEGSAQLKRERDTTTTIKTGWHSTLSRDLRDVVVGWLAAGFQRVLDENEVDHDEPREPALETALAADPADEHAALVYADWYQQQTTLAAS